MTRSPSFHLVTPGPAATTVPETSCPKIWGAATNPYSIFFRSVPQIPQVATRINTSPAPIAGTGTVSTTTFPLPRYTAARIVDGTGCVGWERSRMIPDWLTAPPPYPARWESVDRPLFPQTHPENQRGAGKQIGNREPISADSAIRLASAIPARTRSSRESG